MSIRIVFFTVLIKKSSVRKRYPGGETGFIGSYPYAKEDRYLFGLVTMSGGELEELLAGLAQVGLILQTDCAWGDGLGGPIDASADIVFERIAAEGPSAWSARLVRDDPADMALEGERIVRLLMERGMDFSLPESDA